MLRYNIISYDVGTSACRWGSACTAAGPSRAPSAARHESYISFNANLINMANINVNVNIINTANMSINMRLTQGIHTDYDIIDIANTNINTQF